MTPTRLLQLQRLCWRASAQPPADRPAPRPTRGLAASLLATALTLTSASVALADATVVVEVKSPDGSAADGTVQLSQGDRTLRCTTNQGRCEIKSVPGGAYTVSLEQSGKPASKPKSVMIPPQGEVKLIVAAKP